MPNLATTFETAQRQHHIGDLPGAEQLYRQVLRADPYNAEAAFLLATIYQTQNRPNEALACLEKALRARPNYAEAHHARALLFAAKGDLGEAIEALRQALVHKPDFAEAHHNLGVTLARVSRLDEAIAAFRQAVRCRPDYPEAILNLARAFEEKEDLDEAVRAYQGYLRVRPEDAASHNALGLLLVKKKQPDEAAEAFRRALTLDAGQPGYHNNIGAALAELGRPAEALDYFDEAVRLNPEHAEAHKSRAMTWLQLGDFERGWKEFEWRWQCKDFTPRTYKQPAWDGSAPQDRRILLYTEQGIGDNMQFIRYAPLLAERGARVIVECPLSLVPILGSCSGVAQVVAHGAPLPDFDCHAPLMSLPRLFGTTLDTVPANIPYLSVGAERMERWRREFDAAPALPSGSRLNVGIVWQGNTDNGLDYRRSFPLHCFAPLAAIPGVELYSLQKGRGVEQLADVTGCFRVIDIGSRLDLSGGSFTGTAAAMCNLDLIVTCDTASGHLAGALGRPVWVALSYAADWRFLLGREDSPWYPTMRLFRQAKPGEWGPVFERMGEALRKMAGT